MIARRPLLVLVSHVALVLAALAVGYGCSGSSGGSGGSGASPTSSGNGGAEPCSVNESCGDGYYCKYDDLGCGQKQATGLCAPKNGGADSCDEPDPWCGCDGKIYKTQCDAAAAGVDITVPDPCAPEGTFACATGVYCKDGAEYCIVSFHHDGRDSDGCGESYGCAPYPAECADAPTCECIGPAAEALGLMAFTCFEYGMHHFEVYAINDC